MSTPGGDTGGSTMQGQMLLKISDNVATLVTDVAVIKSQMGDVPQLQKDVRDLQLAAASAQGGRDVQARWVSWVAAAAAVGAGIAGYLHH